MRLRRRKSLLEASSSTSSLHFKPGYFRWSHDSKDKTLTVYHDLFEAASKCGREVKLGPEDLDLAGAVLAALRNLAASVL